MTIGPFNPDPLFRAFALSGHRLCFIVLVGYLRPNWPPTLDSALRCLSQDLRKKQENLTGNLVIFNCMANICFPCIVLLFLK
jgi:hypothetical protein